MSNHSVIEHRANYHYVKLEEDYVMICSQGKQYPHCKAFILAILEQWTNDKRAKGQSTHIYMTYPQWIDALYGLFRRNHVIDCLAELVQENLITRRPCRLHGKDTFEYALNIQEVQARLSKLAERTEKYTRPNINPFKFKRVEKQTGVNLDGNTDTNLNGSERDDPSKFGHNIDSSTEIPSDIDSREGASAPAPTKISSEEIDPDKTEERPIVKPPQKENTNEVKRPPAPSKAHVNKAPFPVPKRAKPQSNIMDEIPLTSEEQAVFDAWCSLFKVDVPLIPANAKACKQLVKPLQVWTDSLHESTAQVLKRIMNWAYKNDKNGYYKRGFKLYDAAREFEGWQSAQERPEKEPSNEHKAASFYSADALSERNKWKMETFLAEYEAKAGTTQGVQS